MDPLLALVVKKNQYYYLSGLSQNGAPIHPRKQNNVIDLASQNEIFPSYAAAMLDITHLAVFTY